MFVLVRVLFVHYVVGKFKLLLVAIVSSRKLANSVEKISICVCVNDGT